VGLSGEITEFYVYVLLYLLIFFFSFYAICSCEFHVLSDSYICTSTFVQDHARLTYEVFFEDETVCETAKQDHTTTF
jgi:hypothetical protein